LLEKEVTTISNATERPLGPVAVVVGGLKVSDKIPMLKKFIKAADYVAVIGAMANTFLVAEGLDVGKSLFEPESIDTAREILAAAEKRSNKSRFSFYLPHDVVVAKSKNNTDPTRVVDMGQHTWADISSYPKNPGEKAYTVQKDEMILDIGPMSAASIGASLSMANTILFNGLAGVTEIAGINGSADPFAHGTEVILNGAVNARSSNTNKATVIVGGGDTVAYVESVEGLREKLGYVSTGGGAALELMSGNKLVGVESLLDKNDGAEVSTES
jgi:phosphoglycerate kinase